VNSILQFLSEHSLKNVIKEQVRWLRLLLLLLLLIMLLLRCLSDKKFPNTKISYVRR
jgi:hypothetical protein